MRREAPVGSLSVQSVSVLTTCLVWWCAVDRGHRALVEVVVLGVDDDVDVRHVAQLTELERGELDLRGTAAAKDVNIGHGRGLKAGLDVGRELRGEEVWDVLCEDAGHVERDVADTQNRDLLGLERPGAGDVGVTVVPGHEVGGAVRAIKVNTRDVEIGVVEGAGGKDDGVVVLAELVEGEVRAHVDVGQQADVAAAKHVREGDDDLLDARVVRRNAVAHQAEGRREPLDDVDGDVDALLREDVGGVGASWSGADDGDAQRSIGGHEVPPGRFGGNGTRV